MGSIQRMIAMAAIMMIGGSALADSYSTTFICTDTKGHKAAQDHSCDSGMTQAKTVDIVHHTLTMQEWVEDLNRHSRESTCQFQCDNLARQEAVNRTELNKSAGSIQRNNIIADRAWIANHCY